MLGRFDIHDEVSRMKYAKLAGDWLGQASRAIGARVVMAAGDAWTLMLVCFSAAGCCGSGPT